MVGVQGQGLASQGPGQIGGGKSYSGLIMLSGEKYCFEVNEISPEVEYRAGGKKSSLGGEQRGGKNEKLNPGDETICEKLNWR